MQQAQREKPYQPSQRVLVVDDDEDFAASLKDMLELADYQAAVANSPSEVSDVIAAFQPSVALIDIKLGGHDGTRLANRLRTEHPQLLCVMMSAFTSAEAAIEALRQGAYDYLRKPFHDDDLFATLGRCFQRLSLEAQTHEAQTSLKHRNEELEQINGRLQRVVAWMQRANAVESVPALLTCLLDQLTAECNASGGSVYIADGDAFALVHETGARHAYPTLPTQSTDHGIYGRLIATQEPVYVDGAIELNRHGRSGWPGYEGESVVAFPLPDGRGGLSGVTALHSRRDLRFSEQDREICLILIAFAVEVIRMLETHEERIELEAQFQHTQKMESLGQLTGGVAHDFNNFLASILGYTELAALRVRDRDDETYEYLQQIGSAGKRASDVIAKMMAFSRMEPSRASAIDVPAALSDVISMLNVSLPSSIELQASVPDTLPPVVVDPVNLHQMVMNLCINARDAMSGKGRITVSADVFEAVRETCTSCKVGFSGNFVELRVTDNGSGMSEAVAARAFEPFFTTKEVGKGTGMGLALIHGMMHEAGGHILLRSSEGTGTAFSLLFPPASIAATDSPATQRSSAHIRAERLSGHALVVDDDPSIARLIGQCLKQRGCEALIMNDSREALATLKDTDQHLAMLIADLTMPGLTGVDLIQQAASLRPGMPTILMTGYNTDQYGDMLDSVGASGFIRKPFRLSAFVELVEQHWP
ncbi:MAG: response regulator [Pseudomonadota bacterium]